MHVDNGKLVAGAYRNKMVQTLIYGRKGSFSGEDPVHGPARKVRTVKGEKRTFSVADKPVAF